MFFARPPYRLETPRKPISEDRMDLSGGLNLREEPYSIPPGQSPNMVNMLWEGGTLISRRGYSVFSKDAPANPSNSDNALYEQDFHGRYVAHIGTELISYDVSTGARSVLRTGISPFGGTFFEYGPDLYYKAPHTYLRIKSDFTVEDVEGYTPIILINADPTTGAGDMYQPENRLSAQKEVRYNAFFTKDNVLNGSADVGVSKQFAIDIGVTSTSSPSALVSVLSVTDNLGNAYTYSTDLATGRISVTAANTGVHNYVVTYRTTANNVYQLPVKGIDSLDKVMVKSGVGDPVEVPKDDYKVDLVKGTVEFLKPPTIEPGLEQNAIRIFYSKTDAEDAKAFDDCRYVSTYGANKNLCILMAGSEAQPNAYFWNGNTETGMSPAYFPIESYNLAGSPSDRIVGFGRQQNFLVVLSTGSVGKTTLETTKVGTREMVNFPYTPINDQIGCDCPWTIQLVRNNVVFCSSGGGAYMVLDTNFADENNIVTLSGNVNGSDRRPGLLNVLSKGVDAAGIQHGVRSFVYDERYVVSGYAYGVNEDEAFVWDFGINDNVNREEALPWFRLRFDSRIGPFAICRDTTAGDNFGDIVALSQLLEIVRFDDSSTDAQPSGQTPTAIDKVYEFAVSALGGYYYLKDIIQVIFVVGHRNACTIDIRYQTDYGIYYDPTPLRSLRWRFVPRDLRYRCLAAHPFSISAVRRPGLRHIRHFAIQLSNSRPGETMVLQGAQILYKIQGRER